MTTWNDTKQDIIARKQFEFIDHSIDQLEELQDKQRCGHCGKIFPLNERGIGGVITIDEIIVLCKKCNEPYRHETWTERNIKNATMDLKKARRNLDSFLEVDPND